MGNKHGKGGKKRFHFDENNDALVLAIIIYAFLTFLLIYVLLTGK